MDASQIHNQALSTPAMSGQRSPSASGAIDSKSRLSPSRFLTLLLFGLTTAYAFIGGLRTVADFDTGWQLAAGRYVVQHHAVPSVDVFTYTIQGKPWIYPPISGVLLYFVYRLGGFAALSLLNALACAAALLLCLRRDSQVSAILAIAAVPLIASRTQPRAELFTILLLAAFVRITWDYYRSGRGPLWLWPLLMLAWVNLHLGFVAGLAVLCGYAGAECLGLAFPDQRAQAWDRLKGAWVWGLLTFAVTVINPWGVFLYRGLARQNAVAGAYQRLVGEWHRQPITLEFLAQALHPRYPASGYWWLLLIAIVAAIVATYRRNFGAAIFLGGAAYLSVAHLRFQAVFALVVIVVVGEMWARVGTDRVSPVLLAVVVMAAILSAVRTADLVTNEAYLANAEISTFGVGASWWFPQGAADFILQHHLPARVFNNFDQGSYLMWRLAPEYEIYVDGRAVPFGNEFLEHAGAVLAAGPDALLLQQEADRYGIEMMVLPASRYAGLEQYPFPLYCNSKQWTPVYLDDVSIVLLRNTAQNQALIAQYGLDCKTYKLSPPANANRNAIALYNYYANSAAIYYLLDRDREALDSYAHALQIFNGDPNLHLAIGQLFQETGQIQRAEQEYRKAIQLRESDVTWFALAQLLSGEQRYPEAIAAMKYSAALSYDPAPRYRALEQLKRQSSLRP